MMTTIYQYDERKFFTGQSREIAPGGGAPKGWTRAAPTELQPGEWAVFSGASGWQVVTTEPEFPPEPVPRSVTKRQAKEALIRLGRYQQSLDALEGITDPVEKLISQNYWTESQTFERDNAVLNAMATDGLGMTQAELDDLFLYAATL